MHRDLEHDLSESREIREQLQADPTLAQELYAGLCNNVFRHASMTAEEGWSCSWRYAGGVVAGLVDPEHQDYLDYYCSGNEGYVSDRIRQMLSSLGWTGHERVEEVY